MQSDWPFMTIGTLVERGDARLQTGPFGSQLHKSDYVDAGIPIIPTEAIGRGVVLDDVSLPQISEAKATELSRHRLRAGDILFARRGIQATGLSAIVGAKHIDALCGTGAILLRVNSDVIVPQFLAAYLATDVARTWLRAHAVGAVMPNLNAGIIGQLRVPLPDISVQREIASLAFALDARIRLLRETSATLESIAKSIFKSWFIDFGPVHAKAEGLEPDGMDAETSALFPDAFEDSALGNIPKGWAVGTLAEHAFAERGLSYKGAGLCAFGEGVPMHNLNSVLEGGDYKYLGIKHYRGDYKERHIAVAGDIIVANTEQGHNHRLIGFPAVVPTRYGKAIFSHHIYRVRTKPDSPLTKHTLYYMLMAPSVREQVIGCANGSTVNMLKVAGLEIPRFVCPSAEIARAFESRAAIFRAQIETNVERAETLAALRDTLLPRLISGKLCLPDAESQVNKAAA
ncbi:hypothetical protein BSFA1_00200 [Burkholderia sp. SFA1]|nr:hypothetical protein BSFA1_00200 [Burkholderia sp. SFA1]